MTRHELKEQLQHDHFTDAVSDVLSYASSHREWLIRWIAIAVVALILAGGALWFTSYRRSVRQQALAAALTVVETPVGRSPQSPNAYPTQDVKQQAEIKVLTELVSKYGGTREALIAQYYLGTVKVERKDSKGAESDLRHVADSASDFSSLAKIALAQLYAGENRIPEAQSLLRSIASKPSDLVSKAQADILLAQLDVTTNPQEAKRIVQSLRGPNQPPAVSRAADQISGQLTR